MARLRWRVVSLAALAGASAMAGTGAVALSLGPPAAATAGGDDGNPVVAGFLVLAVVVIGMTTCLLLAVLVLVGSDDRTANLARLVEAYRGTTSAPPQADPTTPGDATVPAVRRLGNRRRSLTTASHAGSFHNDAQGPQR